MNIGYVNGQFVANPLTRAAGVTMSYVRADGMLIVPANIIGYEQGDLPKLSCCGRLRKSKMRLCFAAATI